MAKYQFDEVPKNDVGASALPEGITVKTMNRYKNILPNPHSRVPLAQLGDDVTTTYINANYISAIDGTTSKFYIAAQGPTPQSVLAFWRMIWQEKTSIIIMVTGLVEGAKTKCTRYWPDAVNRGGSEGILKYGDVVVKVVSAKQQVGYKVAELEAVVKGEQPRTIMHFWYDSWPDFGVPSDPTTVVDMLKMARLSDPQHAHPWVVHCSAGIGRTGTFIGVDAGMQLIDRLNAVDTKMLLEHMRKDRGGMIQTYDQYLFVHAVLETYYRENGAKSVEAIYGNTGGNSEVLYGNINEPLYSDRRSMSFKQVETYYKNVSGASAEKMYSTTAEVFGATKPENDYEMIGGTDDLGRRTATFSNAIQETST